MGNEAVARGIVEANVEIAASYPGTPASEIVDTLALIADEVGMHVQWSTNEMVAFEVAVGGALCGKRSTASMKHIGANWIVDPLMHATYHGFNAGLLVISADDPSGHSSANEQDSRYLAQLAEIPVVEPSDIQEAKDFVKIALELSEEIKLPVMYRLVTRICHSRGDCVLGEASRKPTVPKFDDTYYRDFVQGEGIVGPKVIPMMHSIQHSKLLLVEDAAARKGLFAVEHPDASSMKRLCILTASAPANYVFDYLNKRNLRGKIGVIKLGLTLPFPTKAVSDFVKGYDEVLVVEEGEPYCERCLTALAKDLKPSLKIHGKEDGSLPREGELNYSSIDSALSCNLGLSPETVPQIKAEAMSESAKLLTPRTLTMCAGCPHRSAYYAAKKAIRSVANARYIALGDIGCYTLGIYPPLKFMHDVFCMGSSIGVANGVVKAGITGPVLATIGDSTFFHAGIPALINATFNQANIKVMVLDNQVTAMTGFQPHPGCGETATNKPTKKVSIEAICNACGIDFVRTVDSYDFESCVAAMEDAIKFNGPAVVIFRRVCSQEFLKRARRKGSAIHAYRVDDSKCIGCRTCVAAFGCPAIGFDRERKKAHIDKASCMGCGVCKSVCPNGAMDIAGGNAD